MVNSKMENSFNEGYKEYEEYTGQWWENCQNTREYCLSISASQIKPRLGSEGFSISLPYKIPKAIPDSWKSEFKGIYIEAIRLKQFKGENCYSYVNPECRDCEEEECSNCWFCDDFALVIPLQIPGLVYVKVPESTYIKDVCFMYKGEILDISDNPIIKWDSDNKRYELKIKLS